MRGRSTIARPWVGSFSKRTPARKPGKEKKCGSRFFNVKSMVCYETVESGMQGHGKDPCACTNGNRPAGLAGGRGTNGRREHGNQPGQYDGTRLFRHRGKPDVRRGRCGRADRGGKSLRNGRTAITIRTRWPRPGLGAVFF